MLKKRKSVTKFDSVDSPELNPYKHCIKKIRKKNKSEFSLGFHLQNEQKRTKNTI